MNATVARIISDATASPTRNDKALFVAVRALGLTINKRDGEYRVTVPGLPRGRVRDGRPMIRAAILLMCMTSPAMGPATWTGWRICTTDADCVRRTALACINGDKAACIVAIERHREECADDPEHDDCAAFQD